MYIEAFPILVSVAPGNLSSKDTQTRKHFSAPNDSGEAVKKLLLLLKLFQYFTTLILSLRVSNSLKSYYGFS